jgi:hypothetical protein
VLRQLSRTLGSDETRRLYGAELVRFLPDHGPWSSDGGYASRRASSKPFWRSWLGLRRPLGWS